MADVTLRYKNNVIAELSDSGSKILQTGGKYCEDDIALSYTKPSGGGGASEGDVTFFDYDGSIVASYSAADFANLAALPANPTHPGLTAQGWNWTLADAKAYVTDYGKLNIGQMYITSDGKTRIYIRLEEGRLSPTLGFGINGTATVEWGDGTSSTVTGSSASTVINTQHTYPAAGDYVIAISGDNTIQLSGTSSAGSFVLHGNKSSAAQNAVYHNAIQKVEIGRNVRLEQYAFSNCNSLASVTIPDSVTSIRNSAFASCRCLGELHFKSTTPPSVANANAFSNIPTDCIIYVPTGTLAAYTSATNYPSSSTYTYMEE